MRDLLIYGNSPGRWLSAGGILVGAILLLYVVRRVVMTRLERAAMRTATQVDDFGVDMLRRTKFFFVLAIATDVAAHALVLTADVREMISKAIVIAVAIQIVIWGNGLVAFFIDR